MNWIQIGEIVYLVVMVCVCLRIVYDTRSTLKTIAWLLLTIFFPFVGIILYFSFGINYRKRKLYDKKLFDDAETMEHLKRNIISQSEATLKKDDPAIRGNEELA